MNPLENSRFFTGLFLGSTLTAVLLVSATMHQFGQPLPIDEPPASHQPDLAYAKTDSSAFSFPWNQPVSMVGKTVRVGGESYLIVQEMKNLKTGKMVRLLTQNNTLNRERLEAGINEGYVSRLQCINGKEWFGNKGENKGGPLLLTIWDRGGERLIGYNKTALDEVNAYTGCVRMRKWHKAQVIFEVADLRHAQLQVHYYAYSLEDVSMGLVYAYESYAIENGFLYTWLDSSRQYLLVQQVTGEGGSALYRVPYVEIEALLETPDSLYGYPIALMANTPIQMSLLDEQRLSGAQKGIVVGFGKEATLVEWNAQEGELQLTN